MSIFQSNCMASQTIIELFFLFFVIFLFFCCFFSVQNNLSLIYYATKLIIKAVILHSLSASYKKTDTEVGFFHVQLLFHEHCML